MSDPRYPRQEPRRTPSIESLGRYPGRRNPRKGDLVLTIVLSLVLYALVEQYVVQAIDRGDQHAAFTGGLQFATILAVVAPIVLAVFSTVFSILLILRRRFAFWLPVFAMILIVALYSITGSMLDQAVLNPAVR